MSPARAASENLETEELCPGTLVIEWSSGRESLSDVEKRLVCGDPDLESASTPDVRFDDAWKVIPFPQARFALRNFLQERGYFHLEAVRESATRLRIRTGPSTRVSRLLTPGAPPDLRPERRRKLLGERLTPAILDATEKWLRGRLGALGYACPTLATHANPDSGEVRIEISVGPRLPLAGVAENEIPEVAPGILRRHDAFHPGELLDTDLLSVTENRIASRDTVESIHLTASCGPDGVTVQQRAVAGPPRLLRLGFGINTEGALLGRAAWRNVRLGAAASRFDLTAIASTKTQSLGADFDWFHLPFASRRFLRAQMSLSHENENFYEISEANPRLGYATSWDGESWGFDVLSGPSLELIRTQAGPGPQDSHFLSLRTEWRARSHEFEYWAASPRTGFETDVVTRFNKAAAYSSASAQTLGAEFRVLYDVAEFDPPLWVLGLRGGVNTVLTGESLGPGVGVPAPFRGYLGGSRDLRGFGRLELPGPDGAFTWGFLNLEARLAATLPVGLEPVAFLDLGGTGREPWGFDPPLYWAPGGGLRWASPIGPIRSTLARGLTTGRDGRWQFYLSLGEEF